MVIESLLLKYPTFWPLILLSLGALYFNYTLIRNYAHFHWNLFMVALGLMAAAFVIRLLNLFYTYDEVEIINAVLIGAAAILFAITANVAKRSCK